MDAVVGVMSAVVGLAVGSFLNVVIHRVPDRQSVVSPRSQCPTCGTTLANRDNIPVLSWLLLRGKCRTCSTAISVRYPLVEAATALAFGIVGLSVGYEPHLPAMLVLTAVLISVTAIDLERYIVPNPIVVFSLVAGVVLLGGAAIVESDYSRAGAAVASSVGAFVALFVVHFIKPRGMGMGDVKLAAVIGLYLGYLGWERVALGLFGGFMSGAVIGLALIVSRIKSKSDAVPFAPFMALGAMVSLIWGPPILDWYRGV